jgi:hypothetical protein
MNYQLAYDKLIERSLVRLTFTDQPGEFHHVVPRSMGGGSHSGNLAYLTVKEHLLAHLLLFRMGHRNQIFSVWAMLNDHRNPARKELRVRRWVRKWHGREVQRLQREANRDRLGFLVL